MVIVIGIGVLGVGLSLHGVIVSVPVVVLTVANFCAMGIASAAVVLLVKRGDPISGPLYQATLILSGAIFPVELIPAGSGRRQSHSGASSARMPRRSSSAAISSR
jgi:ABC-2 type transport system permease protein